MTDVFISYARADAGAARKIAKVLKADGFDVWWDADLPAHRSYSDVIEHNLQDARAVLVLWSETSAKSQWVRAEADFARNAGKLVQAQIDGTTPPMPFNQIQCADLKGLRAPRSNLGWAKVCSSIRSLCGAEQALVLPTGRPLFSRLFTSRQFYVAAVVVALALIAALFIAQEAGPERKPVLAVLPFTSVAPRDSSLVAGMWDDTRQAIGRNPQLIVLGPKTAQELANEDESATKQAADYVLRASIRTIGDRIRITAELTRTKDAAQIWSQTFDRKLDDVFALQSQIASEIEGRIRGRLAEKGGVTPEHIATSGELYALYSDARAKIRKQDPDLAPAARTQLEQVVKADPNFAPAWAALSQVIGEIRPSDKNYDVSDPAEPFARKAIDLAPNLAAAHAALARALGLKGPVARSEIAHAVKLDPNDYQALLWLGQMQSDAGDTKAALQSSTQALKIEPLFWPAVFTKYRVLRQLGDDAGVEQLISDEQRLGGDYFGLLIRMDRATDRGNVADAVNTGFQYWRTGREGGRKLVGEMLWSLLLQLGYFDEARRFGYTPDFGPALWRNDPKGLDLLEAHDVSPLAFFSAHPLPENAGRVYLLSGRGAKLAEMYLSLQLSPQKFSELGDGDPKGFLYVAPLISIALREHGHTEEATRLLSTAEMAGARAVNKRQSVSSAGLARIYAVEGKRNDALALLERAVSAGWLPQPPLLLPDLHSDPALATLKGEPRFEQLRERILRTVASQRARVNWRLLPRTESGSDLDQAN